MVDDKGRPIPPASPGGHVRASSLFPANTHPIESHPPTIAALSPSPESNGNGSEDNGAGMEVGMECVLVGQLKCMNVEWTKSVAGCEIGERAEQIPE